MTAALTRVPQWLALGATCAAALVFAAVIAVQPLLAVGAVAAAGIFALAFLRPAAHLTALLFVTAVVPYGIQNRYGFGSGAGLILSDVMLAAALLWAVPVVAQRRLDRRSAYAVTAIAAMLAVATLQAFRSWYMGGDLSQSGYELRVLAGWATIVVALPLLQDRAARARLFAGMLVVGILVGLYGLIQYFELLGYYAEGDAGLREGVRFTSSGKGQIQGGLFAFPVGVLIGFAVLTANVALPRAAKAALMALVVLNAIGLLLTYERTFWIAVVAGLGLIALRAGLVQRLRLAVLLTSVVLIAAPVLATVAPGALSAAAERALSLNQYGSDNSIRYRLQEGRHVADKIQEHPLIGSGLADQIFFGLPWLQTPPSAQSFAHNGYLWLAWKIGIPAALILFLTVAWAVVARPPPGDPLFRAVRLGAQASMLVMLVVSVTFPSFSALHITAVAGVLLALCLYGSPARDGRGATRAPSGPA